MSRPHHSHFADYLAQNSIVKPTEISFVIFRLFVGDKSRILYIAKWCLHCLIVSAVADVHTPAAHTFTSVVVAGRSAGITRFTCCTPMNPGAGPA